MRATCLFFACLHVLACGDGVTPVLSDLAFEGQAVDSPLVLLLRVDFNDPDADLADGHLETFINKRATSAGQQPLLPLYLQSDLDPRVSWGRLHFVLELSLGDDPPPSGSSFQLGARVTDADGHLSSTEELSLRLTY